MKFKLVENYDQARDFVQEYAYEVIDELGNASLEEYIQWFMSEFTYFDEEVKQAVKDFYIEAIDCGKIKRPKTMITSELTTYLKSNVDLIDKNIAELIDNCPDHLKYELTLVLDKIAESLNESVLNEAIRPDLKRFIEQHAELLNEDNIEEVYKQCPRELKVPLVRILTAASVGNNVETIKRATFLADSYDDEELINLVLSVGEHANDVFDAFDYIMNDWDEFFTDDMLNEDLLTEKMWVRLEDNIKPNPFYFYTINKNITSDINTLIDVISRSGSGTYKQQLDQDILKELRANYATALSSGVTYTLTPIKPKIAVTEEELSANKTRIITITDRSLRREAEKDILISTGKNPKEWLIHHKIKGEENNILSNIALVSRNSASKLDDAVAHAIHKILENQGNPEGTITPATFHVNIEENVRGHWAVTHTVDITIR